MSKQVILGAVVAAMAVGAFSAAACHRAEATGTVPAEGQETLGTVVPILVDGRGFTPSAVTVKKGERLILELTRITDATCATSVTLPELHITKDLPLNKAVRIPIPTETSRTVTFSCGMGMLKGTVVVS